DGAPQPPLTPATRKRARAAHTYNMAETGAFKKTLGDIIRFCRQQGTPADTTISENGPCQYEINLHHETDALAAADHAVLLKRVIKGTARRDGMMATFMAKPYAARSGSGMHVHFSVLDKDGHNIFMNSAVLKHAIGGLMKTMPDGMAVFAPNANSYRRL